MHLKQEIVRSLVDVELPTSPGRRPDASASRDPGISCVCAAARLAIGIVIKLRRIIAHNAAPFRSVSTGPTQAV